MKKTILVVFAIAFLFTSSAMAADKWKPDDSWSFKGGWSAIFNAAKKLPKHAPLTFIKAYPKERKMEFKSDWDSTDIPKTATIYFHPEGKGMTKVDVTGVSNWHAYKTLTALGEILRQPLPPPPKDRKFR